MTKKAKTGARKGKVRACTGSAKVMQALLQLRTQSLFEIKTDRLKNLSMHSKHTAQESRKLPGLLDCPLEIIGLISAALVKNQDELRTTQVRSRLSQTRRMKEREWKVMLCSSFCDQ